MLKIASFIFQSLETLKPILQYTLSCTKKDDLKKSSKGYLTVVIPIHLGSLMSGLGIK